MNFVESFDYRQSAFVKYPDEIFGTGRQQIPIARANVNPDDKFYFKERQRCCDLTKANSNK